MESRLLDLYVFIKHTLNGLNGLPFKIRDQVLDSAFSISSNLSEGYCRKSIKEYIQFVNVALGSCGRSWNSDYKTS